MVVPDARSAPPLARFLNSQEYSRRASQLILDGPDGVLDFSNRRCFFHATSAEDRWYLYAGGSGYVGRPGSWTKPEQVDLRRLVVDGPFWLMSLVEVLSTVQRPTCEASERGPWDLYSASASIYDAADVFASPIFPFPLEPFSDPSAVRLEIWADDRFLRRVSVTESAPGANFGRRTEIELSGFGEVGPIAAPDGG